MSVLAVLLLVCMLVPDVCEAATATSGKIYAVDAENEGLLSNEEGSDHALYENYGYLSLKPAADSTGKITFTIKASKAANYSISVIYTAKEGDADRKMGIYANDEKNLKEVNLNTAEDWDTFKTYAITLKLKKGTNKIVITSPSDYDDSNVKTPNIYCLKYTKKAAKTKKTTK